MMTDNKEVPPPEVVRRARPQKPDGERGYSPPPRRPRRPSAGKPQGDPKKG